MKAYARGRWLGVLAVAALLTLPRPAPAQIGNNPNPIDRAGARGYSAELFRRIDGAGGPGAAHPHGQHRHHPHRHHGGHPWTAYPWVDPYWGYPYPAYPYPYYLGINGGVFGPYVAPPLYLPAEALYGPQAIRRFMGVDPLVVPQPAPQVVVVPQAGGAGAGRDPAARPSNAEARGRAWRFIEFGDAQFAQQNFHGALQRYKSASEAAMDVADAWLRQAIAQAAMGRTSQAAAALRRALALNPRLGDLEFRLDDLYRDNQVAKAAHLDRAAQAAADRPDDADALLVFGLLLYFDGQAAHARPVLAKAAGRLEPAQRRLLDDLLQRLPAEPPAAAPARPDAPAAPPAGVFDI
jgi:Tfp pilus assembly protein PilF